MINGSEFIGVAVILKHAHNTLNNRKMIFPRLSSMRAFELVTKSKHSWIYYKVDLVDLKNKVSLVVKVYKKSLLSFRKMKIDNEIE